MRLKYLSLCLLSLSMSACTQHVIKSNSENNLSLADQATQGLNALYENASYDMKGQFSIQTDLNFNQQSAQEKKEQQPQPAKLDPLLKKKIDQLIKIQNIPFSQKEKNVLYQALANESLMPNADYRRDRQSAKSQMAQSVVNVLNDLQFSYNGSIHFKQKIAALTLQLNYQKPTLQVQAQLPMIVDFNDHKFYANYFAFMPFIVNRESQGRLAYIDFSKHKNVFEKIDLKKFAEYLKQQNALSYLLAEPEQVHALPLSNDEKAQGLVKKIRFTGDIETLMAQIQLYDYVNEIYYTEQIKGDTYKGSSQDDIVDEAQVEAVEAATEAAEAAAMAAEGDADHDDVDQYDADNSDIEKAYASAERVGQLVNEKMHHLMYHEHEAHGGESADSEHEERIVSAEEVYTDAESVVNAADAAGAANSIDSDHEYYGDDDSAEVVDATAVVEDEESQNLSEEVCEALIKTKNVPIGKVTLCNDYQAVQIISAEHKSEQKEGEVEVDERVTPTVLAQLKPLFKPYQTQQLIDAQQFKLLWKQHETEINQALAVKKAPSSNLVADVSLDHKGRVQNIDYSFAVSEAGLGKIHLKSTNQILNYGNATAIDRQALKNAQSIEEVTKGSMLENVLKGILGPITGEKAASNEVVDAAAIIDNVELPEYLSTVALQSYQRHQSELKAYQAAFAVAFAGYRPEYIKYYSTKDLNEIAEVYAYKFIDSLDEPTGQALKRLNQLRDKHALKTYEDFDDLGSTVGEYMQLGIRDYKEKVEWDQLKKKFKTNQAIFAHLYQQYYLDGYEFENESKADLIRASQIYAKAYVDDTNNQLSETSLNGLKAVHEDFFSADIYSETYRYMQKHLK